MEKTAIQQYFENRGIEVLPDSKGWINRFEIESETSNRVYIIAQRSNLSEWACSCPGWKRFRHCKHLASVKPMIAAAERAANVNPQYAS